MLDIQKIKDGVQLAAQEYPIKKAELFGSYANGTNRPDSDVDLLLEFKSPRISLLTLSAIKYRLEDILKTDVDVIHGPLPSDSMIVVDRKVALYESERRNYSSKGFVRGEHCRRYDEGVFPDRIS